MFSFATPRPRRRPSLTPMIDVVFLLLVFFMLVSQFGREGSTPLDLGGAGGVYQGPPRLVTIEPEAVRLNGQVVALDALAETLASLMQDPSDIIVLRGADGAVVQDLTRVMDVLRRAGLTGLVVVE